jgi:putative phosphoribosyl transferase
MFRDRSDAGHQLADVVAEALVNPAHPTGVTGGLVLGLPRGGVPVAAVIAELLNLPLDVLVVRKVGLPWQPELALGAVGEHGAIALNDEVVSAAGVGPDQLDSLMRRASAEVQDILAALRPARPALDLKGRMVIVVDDGVATGATARAAASVLRRMEAGQVVLATPVAAVSVCEALRSYFDEVICVSTPNVFGSVGQHYRSFDQVSIPQVRRLLEWTSP